MSLIIRNLNRVIRFFLMIMLVAAFTASANGLRLAKPTIANEQLVVPVLLDKPNVAAFDFRLEYDPSVFTPLISEISIKTENAGKQLMTNIAKPGSYNFLVMGFNQELCPTGKVAKIVLKQIGKPDSDNTVLRINKLNLSSPSGDVLDAADSELVIQYGANSKTHEKSNSASHTVKSQQSTTVKSSVPSAISRTYVHMDEILGGDDIKNDEISTSSSTFGRISTKLVAQEATKSEKKSIISKKISHDRKKNDIKRMLDIVTQGASNDVEGRRGDTIIASNSSVNGDFRMNNAPSENETGKARLSGEFSSDNAAKKN